MIERDRLYDTIRILTESYGPSGNEGSIRELIQQQITGLADEVRVDALGNLLATRHSKGGDGSRKVMIAAHMDEIGLIATFVDSKGFVRFGAIGGVSPVTLVGSRVRFGNGVTGVIGVESLEDRNKLPSFEQLFIDVGASDKASSPVKPGDEAGFVRPFEVLGDRLVAKTMDDRIGCAVVIEAMRQLKDTPHEIAFVFTVQEEVGLRGARTSAYSVQPDMGLSVDVTGTGDTPEGPKMAVRLGDGAAIKVRDSGMLTHSGVKDLLIRRAEEAGIRYQLEVLERGSTDAAIIQMTGTGVPAGCISIPCRYVHTPSEMVDARDVEACIHLLVATLSKGIDI